MPDAGNFSIQQISCLFAVLWGEPGVGWEPADATVGAGRLREVARDGEHVLGELYERYKGLIYSLSLPIIQDVGRAEDVTLDAFNQ